jgi:LemA protein
MFVFSIWLIIIVLLILVAVGVVTYGVGIYNSLVQVRNNVDKTFKNIDVLLLQRHDEIPKLVETCKAYMKYEKDILENLIRLRERYREAKTIDEKTEIENDIGKQLTGLNVRMEAYPDLKASQHFSQIQGRISGLESGIADRRELFNDSVNIYNIQIERFPHVILARLLSYTRRAFLEVPEGKKEDVKIDFS